jgi:hypothetical protein
VNALTASMWVKGSVASYGCLLRGHALEIDGMHWVWNELLHVIQDLLLSLKWSHPFKRRTGDPDVKVVTASVQINDFDVGIWHCFEHLCFEPFRTDHDQTNASSSLNMCLGGFLQKSN